MTNFFKSNAYTFYFIFLNYLKENNNDIPPDQIGLNSRVYVEPQEKPVDEDNDELYINKDSQSEIDYFENERTSVKQTKEEKEKIAKAILKENFKEAKMLKSLP